MSKEKIKCGTCNGKGTVQPSNLLLKRMVMICPVCNGKGLIINKLPIYQEDDGGYDE